MIVPQRAPVRPRILTSASGAALPLDEEILALCEKGARGAVQVHGPPGSGKTTALQHLAAVLPEGAALLLDEPGFAEVSPAAAVRLVVFTAAERTKESCLAVCRLAPWKQDELIEYLLATHHDHCSSVLARVSKADHSFLQGLPELWRVVLDRLALDPALAGARPALRGYLTARMPSADVGQRLRGACLEIVTAGSAGLPTAVGLLTQAGIGDEATRVLHHAPVQLMLAAEQVAEDLHARAGCDYLTAPLPRELVRSAGTQIAGDGQALDFLRSLLASGWKKQVKKHAMAASLLLAADAGWVPKESRPPNLEGAYLEHAAWPGAHLAGAKLRRADLDHANLQGANLDRADAAQANLNHANLASSHAEKACFEQALLTEANFTEAVLRTAIFRGANLTGAVLAQADLSYAVFSEAEILGADFSGADLHRAVLQSLRLREAEFRGASFADADLQGCDLEEIELPGADFRLANLQGALLTGAVMLDADFTGANLREAGLGDVELERANLRDADLRGATFHMGSSRSGTLITPIASEGTRTGFYTDDSEEQNFKAPEEIRKANLCGADLRGARTEEVDFYLVDLRGARYDSRQEEHFRRCRAILEDPC